MTCQYYYRIFRYKYIVIIIIVLKYWHDVIISTRMVCCQMHVLRHSRTYKLHNKSSEYIHTHTHMCIDSDCCLDENKIN